jgi:hypothetical protein
MQKRGDEEMPYITAILLEIKTTIAAMIFGSLGAEGKLSSAGKEVLPRGEGRRDQKNPNCQCMPRKNSARNFSQPRRFRSGFFLHPCDDLHGRNYWAFMEKIWKLFSGWLKQTFLAPGNEPLICCLGLAVFH